MTTFTKITADSIETITEMDLRAEAAAAVARGELVWFAQGEYAGTRTQVVAFDNGRAGLAAGANAAWGEGDVIGDDGEAASWTLTLDEDGKRLNVDGRELCCYEGCTAHATEEDSEGDACCERHYWQEETFVELHDFGGASLDADSARKYRDEMAELGWTVEVREPRSGEAEGTYYRKSDGTLQILGYSIEVPASYEQDSHRAYDRALKI